MFGPELEAIGLSPNEAKVYETLLDLGETSVTEIALKSNIHRRSIYDTLNRLLEKGLVFQIFQKKETLYRPVEPSKCLEVLREKENAFKRIAPHLEKLYYASPQKNAAFIYKGIEGYKNYLRDLARVGEDTYFLGAKALWFTPNVPVSYLRQYQSEMTRKKKTYHTLFDHRVKQKLPQAMKNVGGEFKVLPKEYSTPGVMDVFGDYVVTFTSVDVGNFGEDGTVFVMINKELAESYRTWFQFIWDFCPETK